MTFSILILAALGVAAIAGTTRSVVRDGYRPVPTRYTTTTR